MLYLLHISDERGISSIRLNKLIYFAHGWTLAYINRPFIDNSDNQIQAWTDGPVIPHVYHTIKVFGNKFIRVTLDKYTKKSICPDHDKSELKELLKSKHGSQEDNDDLQTIKILNWIWRQYNSLNDYDLIDLSHVKDGPWDKCWRNGADKEKYFPIKDEDIKSYFDDHKVKN